MNVAASSLTTPSAVQGVCPDGWHLPSDAEWTELSDYVIANSAGSSKYDIGPYLKSTSGSNSSGNGTDNFSFSGLPGGYRIGYSYYNVGYNGYWWSSTEHSSTAAYSRDLDYNSDFFNRYGNGKSNAVSVRCLQISSSTKSPIEQPVLTIQNPSFEENLPTICEGGNRWSCPEGATIRQREAGDPGIFGMDKIDPWEQCSGTPDLLPNAPNLRSNITASDGDWYVVWFVMVVTSKLLDSI